MKVKDILAHKPPGVIHIAPDKSLHAASQLLAEHNIGVLLVTDAENHPVGILSERDIVRALAQHGAAALDHPVSSGMTRDIITALPDDDLFDLGDTMTDHRIRHLPIMQGETVQGIVSIGDIVKAQLSHFQNEARALEQYITGDRA